MGRCYRSPTLGRGTTMANHYTRQIPDLSEAQEQELQRWVRRAKTAQALVLRARIVLQTAAGKSDMEVAGQLGTTPRDRGQVAAAVSARRLRWLAGRAAPGSAAHDRGRRRGAGGGANLGNDPGRCYALDARAPMAKYLLWAAKCGDGHARISRWEAVRSVRRRIVASTFQEVARSAVLSRRRPSGRRRSSGSDTCSRPSARWCPAA